MLVAGVLLSALALFASAKPIRRATGLTVNVAGPAEASSVDELKLIATVANTGSESVKMLKYGTVLDDQLPTRSFSVTKNGTAVDFTGIKMTVSLEDLDDSALVTIAPGEEKTFTHDVSALFNFEAAGEGTFTFEPVTMFMIPGSDEISALAADQVTVTASNVEVNVSGDLAQRDVMPESSKRAVDTCSNTSERSFIDSAYSEGKSLASQAASYINSRGRDSLFSAYYGSSSTSTVASVFSRVASESSSSRTLNCNDAYGACTSGVIAYTVIATTNVYFCSIFFNEVTSSRLCSGTSVASRNVRGGTVLHELTHATSSTDDITYGCSADQQLSDSNQVDNADNYNCFSTQVYANTQC